MSRLSILGSGAMALIACAPAERAPERFKPKDGTAEMAAELRRVAARVNPANTSYLINDRRAEMFARELEQPQPPGKKLMLQFSLALERLNSGRIQDCLDVLNVLEKETKAIAPAAWQAQGPKVRLLRAVAYLRLAEEQNCHQGHNRDSCLMPIRGGGVHLKREGATRALEVLKDLLRDEPDNLTARWLVNVAHMTLGSYPDGVPPKYLIPPKVFDSEYPLPRFDNVASEVGLYLYGLSGGAVLDDFDKDGRLDLMVSAIGLEDQTRLFHNKGDGRFEDRTERSGLGGEVGGLNMVQADYDNDGFVDVLVLRGAWMGEEGRFPLSLLRNNGDFTFSDVTASVGLVHAAPTQTATWLDYDGDGWLDLFVGNETAKNGTPNPCELFHSNGDGTFTSVPPAQGIAVTAFVKGVTSGDYNNDGRPDVYVSMLGGDNRLYRNDGPAPDGKGWRFTEVGREAGVTAPRFSFGTAFFDYDNDGWLDLFVVGYSPMTAGDVAADYLGLETSADRGRLYHNRGNGTFEDVSQAAGLFRVIPAMGFNFGDLDNDGFLDLYLGTGNPDLGMLVPNRMFRNDSGKRFQDVTSAGNFGHLQKGHGVAFGDLDNDGDQDVFEEMGGAYLTDKAVSALYENPGGAGHWLEIEIEGVRSNRSAIGARVKLELETPQGKRFLHRSVGSGGSFGASPLRVEVGLGDATRVAAVEVTWPATGQTQKAGPLAVDRRYRIREGADGATPLERPTFRLARNKEEAPSN